MGTCKYCGKDAYGMPDGRWMMDEGRREKEEFDELLIEKSAKSIWVHFAVRP